MNEKEEIVFASEEVATTIAQEIMTEYDEAFKELAK